jgi:hypothetical protein
MVHPTKMEILMLKFIFETLVPTLNMIHPRGGLQKHYKKNIILNSVAYNAGVYLILFCDCF